MKTSTASDNKDRCPKCGDSTKRDLAGRGFVAHKHYAYCDFERGKKD